MNNRYDEELSDPERMRKTPDLVDLFLLAAPGGIERQEARGQEAFVNTASLPRIMQNVARTQLETLGFKFGENIDDLFIQAELPEGWQKKATDHSMWSKLFDSQGRERAMIFYKAAFYDRKAHMSLTNRYTCGTRPVGGWDAPRPHASEGYVTDAGVDIHVTAPTEPEPAFDRENREPWDKWSAAQDARRAEAKAWLDEHYPDFQNPLAYWD